MGKNARKDDTLSTRPQIQSDTNITLMEAGKPRNFVSIPGIGERFFLALKHPERLWVLLSPPV